jgi:cell division protein FtsB
VIAMERINNQEDLIKRYLLGELSATEQTALEDEYFIDPSKYAQLRNAEDELLDAAARGSLSEADRERFERSYLTNPGRRRHAMFARALTRVVDDGLAARATTPRTERAAQIERADTKPSWQSRLAQLFRGPRFVTFITTALLIGLGAAWFVIETSRLRARLAEARSEGETLAQRIADLEAQYKLLAEERERLQVQLQAAKETALPTSRPAPVFFALSLNAFRPSNGQGPRTLMIPQSAEEARLRINLSEYVFPNYQVMLLTPDGREVFARKGLKPQATRNGYVLVVSVPARKFADGDNIISLNGISGAGEVDTLGKTIVKVRRR